MAPTDPAPARQLADILTQELAHLSDLQGRLEAEADVLARRGFDSLTQVSAEKQASLDALHALQECHARLVQAAGYGGNPGGTERFILAQPQPQRRSLHDQWRRVRSLLKACQDLNLVNGSIIAMNLRHCREAVALLTGKTTGESLYDPSGNAAAPATQRPAVKA